MTPEAEGRSVHRVDRWKDRIAALKADAHALYLASRDPRVPWPAKLVAALVVAYALSPIDLIPDFIPVLGQLDDLLLVPLGIALAIRLIPAAVFAEHLELARQRSAQPRHGRWVGVAIVVTLWLAALAWLGSVAWRFSSKGGR